MIEIPCKINSDNVIAVQRSEQAFYAPLAPSCWVVMYAPDGYTDENGIEYYFGISLTEDEIAGWVDSTLTFDPQAQGDALNK